MHIIPSSEYENDHNQIISNQNNEEANQVQGVNSALDHSMMHQTV